MSLPETSGKMALRGDPLPTAPASSSWSMPR